MFLRSLIAAILSLAVTSAVAVELTVAHSHPSLFKSVHEDIAKRFMAQNPDITIKLRATAENYETLTQDLLRDSISGSMPDVFFQGFDRLRVFADRSLIVPLAPMMKPDQGWKADSYSSSALDLGKVGETQYGIPFAMSSQIVYYNAELVRKAGYDPDKFPKSWPEILEIAGKIQDLGGSTVGLNAELDGFGWQSLVFAQGGRMLTPDEKEVAFDGAEGRAAMKILHDMGKIAKMPAMSPAQGRQAFVAGTLGIYVGSIAWVGVIQRDVGKRVDVRTALYPMTTDKGHLPTGGNAAVIATKDAEKQKAAWKYIQFVTGALGSTIMVRSTGYIPANQDALKDPALLGKFYEENPLQRPGIRQLPIMIGWYAFPGANGLKISTVIVDAMQEVYTLRQEPDAALKKLADDVRKLLK
jgi:multiple sugar transport system substrate-binding protein